MERGHGCCGGAVRPGRRAAAWQARTAEQEEEDATMSVVLISRRLNYTEYNNAYGHANQLLISCYSLRSFLYDTVDLFFSTLTNII